MHVQSALLAQFRDAVPCARTAASDELAHEFHAGRDLSSVDPVISAALLVTSAFRMRDEAALIATLRLLTNAIAVWEAGEAAAAVADD